MRPTVEDAETAALEQCQVFFGQPCVLLAVDEAVYPLPPGGSWSRRDMPRARYAGSFDPAQIPGLRPAARERADIANYRSAPDPKAAAYHPNGSRVFIISEAATRRAAEEEALNACNIDESRNGADGSCFLYAVGNQVVLPRRLREPIREIGRERRRNEQGGRLCGRHDQCQQTHGHGRQAGADRTFDQAPEEECQRGNGERCKSQLHGTTLVGVRCIGNADCGD